MHNDTTPFWLVWCPQGLAPTYRHPNSVSAEVEAGRLARLNPGKEFYVLEPVALVQKRDIEVRRFEAPRPF